MKYVANRWMLGFSAVTRQVMSPASFFVKTLMLGHPRSQRVSTYFKLWFTAYR